jgi:hypothetical protein
MTRRHVVVLALVVLSATVASATERDCVGSHPAPAEAPAVDLLTQLFEHTEITDPISGEVTKIEGMEVLVVRLGTDGKPVLACVDSKEAARRFLDKPVEAVGSRKAQER